MTRAVWTCSSLIFFFAALAGQPRISLDKSDIDLGILYRGNTKKASFTITNTGNEPLKILQVVPSCGCTALKKPKDLLQPGESEDVEIEFNSSTFRGRVESKRVDILSNDPLAEYASVRLTADVREELVPEKGSSLLWFGSLAVGTTSEQQIVFRNVTDKAIRISSIQPSNPRVSVATSSRSVNPNGTVEVTVVIRADKEGYTPDHIDLRTDSKNQSLVTVNVSFIGIKGSS